MADYNFIEHVIRKLTKNIYTLDDASHLFENNYGGKIKFILFNTTDPLKIIKNVPYKNNFCKISGYYYPTFVLCYCCKKCLFEIPSDEINEYRINDVENQISYFFHPKCLFDLSLDMDKIILKVGREEFNKKIYNILLFMNNDLISDIFIEIGKIFINILIKES
jgi:hypothetical protein